MRSLILTCGLFLSTAAFAQTTRTAVDFMTVNRGGIAFETTPGTTDSMQVGYARIQPTASTVPSGVAIIGYRANDVLITEAGVAASTPILSGRTFAEVNGPVNTGIAFANPGSSPVVITFHLTNLFGADFGQRTFMLGANAQIAAFLNEAPFNVSGTVVGTFTFTATVPVAVVALRGFTNSLSEFLMTTQPVISLPESVTSETVIMPHFADGRGWQTQVILINPGDETLTGTVQFFGQGSIVTPAAPISLNVDGLIASSFSYTVRAKSSVRLQTGGTSTSLRVGSVRATPAGGTRSPVGFLVFSYSNGATIVTEASVLAQRPAIAWRVFVESTEEFGDIDSIASSVAIANTSLTTATITVELTTLDGVTVGAANFFNIPGNGQRSLFLDELFPQLRLPFPRNQAFRGILRITSGTTQTVVAGLRSRYNERGDFLVTTVPPTNETGQASTAAVFFPHFADGGGYTTQFLLFSGIFGQNTAGALQFLTKTGSPMMLTIE